MKIPTELIVLTKNPVVKKAGAQVLSWITAYGITQTIDKVIDLAAYNVALRIYEQEQKQKRTINA